MTPQLNWLDRAIMWFSPRAGLTRARARMVTDHVARLSYDGARTGRRTAGWTTSGGSGNAEVASGLIKLRERSRDLVRNNSYAARLVDEIVGHVIGTGITAQSATASEKLNAQIDEKWARWIEECDSSGRHDFYGVQDLVMREVVEAGECLVRRRRRFPTDGLTVPLQIQVLEPDYLDFNKTQQTDTGYIINGVEFNFKEDRIAYWLFGGHPGDVIQTNRRGNTSSAPVPAEDIIHVYKVPRGGQVRGVPWMAPVMTVLRDLDEYEEAELVRKKIEACFAAFVTQTDDGSTRPVGIPSTDETTGKRVETFEPGMIEYLRPGEDVKVPTLTFAGGYGEYLDRAQGKIAAGIANIALFRSQLTGNLSEINYSSFKGGMLSFRAAVDGFRWKTFIPQFCRPVRRWFLEAAFPMEDVSKMVATEWHPPAFGTVDPLKDAQAALTDVRMGRSTWAQAVAELGYDPRKQLAEIAKWNKAFDDAGVVLDCDPRKVAKTGVEQPSEQPQAKPAPQA